jgi:AcrR family transcriptional regulator
MVSSATRGRGRPPGISERVRRDVFEAVQHTLVTQGYATLRMEDIASAAGVHRSTLYRQWATKAQLVRDVLTEETLTHYPRIDEGSWAADVDALCRELVRLFRARMTIAFVRTRAVAEDPDLIAGLHERDAVVFDFVLEPFRRAAARGEVDAAFSVRTLAEMLIAPFVTRVVYTRIPVDEEFGASVAAVMRAVGRSEPDRSSAR